MCDDDECEKCVFFNISTHGFFDVDPTSGTVTTGGRPDTGGQTVYTVELTKALGRLGYPSFLIVRWFDPVKPELQQLGKNAWLLRVRGGEWGFVRKEEIYPVLPDIANNLTRFIERDWKEMFGEAGLTPPDCMSPALFHGHYVDGGIVADITAGHSNVPFFWTSHSLGALKRERLEHDLDDDQRAEMEFTFNFGRRIAEEQRIMEEAINRGGQTLTAKTERHDIRRLYGVDPVRSTFIPPGVDTDRFWPMKVTEREPSIQGFPPKGPVVLMGGRIARTKGYELALYAFREVLRVMPEANLVLFGGSDNPSQEEREVLALMDDFREREGIARRVYFLGGQPQDRLPWLYRRADVFLMPSRHEPFGMVALEAAACGAPVVVSSHSGLARELKSGQNCLVVDPEDTPAFAQAILRLLGDREFAAAIARDGVDTINGHYGWDGSAKKHIDFWRKYGANIPGDSGGAFSASSNRPG